VLRAIDFGHDAGRGARPAGNWRRNDDAGRALDRRCNYTT
jgi:hypothetical protein